MAAKSGAYRSRVRIVSGHWRRKVEFSTPQAQKAITRAVDDMAGLMDRPMTVDGEPALDDAGKPISRRKFWRLTRPDEALEMSGPDAVDELETLEELADVFFLARFDQQTLTKLYANSAFIGKCAAIRDENDNSILHWAAAADLPRKILSGLLSALERRAGDEAVSEEERAAAIAALTPENADQVRLHEIAFAMKDESLAQDLMKPRAGRPSVKPSAGRVTFAAAIAATSKAAPPPPRDTAAEYAAKLKAIAGGDAPAPEAPPATGPSAATISEREKMIKSLIEGDGDAFRTRLRDAIKVDGGRAYELFFDVPAKEAARNRGVFHFGAVDAEQRDWLYHVIRHGDGELLDNSVVLIERHAGAIADLFVAARPGLAKDDVRRQLLRLYLKSSVGGRLSLIGHAIASRKTYFVKRLLEISLYPPHEVTGERDARRRDSMRSRNMNMLAGGRLSENLFLLTAMLDSPDTTNDEEASTTLIMKILEILFEPLDDAQGYELFQMYYEVGEEEDARSMPLYDFISENPNILPRVKEGLRFYADMYIADEV